MTCDDQGMGVFDASGMGVEVLVAVGSGVGAGICVLVGATVAVGEGVNCTGMSVEMGDGINGGPGVWVIFTHAANSNSIDTIHTPNSNFRF